MRSQKAKVLLTALAFGLLAAVLNYHSIVYWAWRQLPPPHLPFDNSSDSAVAADLGHHTHPILRPTFADLAYANRSPFQKLDLYLPARGSGPTPLVIWIHGGGLRFGDKKSMPRRDFGPPPRLLGLEGPFQIQVPDVVALTNKGYAVVSLNYRLMYKPGDHIYKAAVAAFEDAKSAVRFLRANAARYNLDPGRFAAWGDSAGGYMAAMLGVTGDQPTIFDDPSSPDAGTSSAVQAVVVWYGAVDADFLSPDIRMVHYIPTANVLPPFLIANGDTDPNLPVRQAKRFHEALLKAGGNSTLTILKGAGHEDPAYMATQMLPTFAFLDRVFGR
jgi:acetyl esterase/lipase